MGVMPALLDDPYFYPCLFPCVPVPNPMPPPAALPLPEAAILLVLLAAPGTTQASSAVSAVALTALQRQLGAAVRVLRIDASSHPSVVSSFRATELPCFVLLHHGLELWRGCGLPDVGSILPLLS
jgi:hypothetical protein